MVKVHPSNDKRNVQRMYAILDDQSNRTLGRPEFFDKMGVALDQTQKYTLVSCAGTHMTQGRHAQGFTVTSCDNSYSLTLPDILECSEIPNTRSEIPTPEILRHYKHLQDIKIPDLVPGTEILLLIGRDLPEAHHIFEQRIGPRNSPFAQRLGLGWVVVGDVCTGKAHKPDLVNVLKTCILEDGRPTIFPQCDYKLVIKSHGDTPNLNTDIFAKTKHDDKPGLSIEDKEFLQIMDKGFMKDKTGHWSAPLPFRKPRARLANNKPQALKRAHMLDTSLKKNAVKRRHFTEFMEEIFQNVHAEIAPPLKEKEECWYLPVFGVYHPKKKDQIRAVFDSSAKYEGHSLSSVLLSGPDLTNNLTGILLRFRENAVGITGDNQQMFYQFYVHEHDRNFLRFLWYEDNDTTKELMDYRMCDHVFGNSPSPAVASYGPRRIANLAANTIGTDVKNFMDQNFYVDDGITSVESPDEAVSLVKRTQKALYEEGGLKFHKIASSDKEVLKAFPEVDLEKNLKTLDFSKNSLPVQRSLGLSWDLEKDCFIFQIADLQKKPLTKRGVLSGVNSLYDPLGFLSPVTLGGKLILRKVTSECTDWDEPLTGDVQEEWETWLKSIQDLKCLSIPRRYFPSNVVKSALRDLYIFCDASEKAIATAAFLRATDDDGQQHASFVLGKSKVAPQHGHTIPRLELCVSVLAVKIGEIISEELSLPKETIKYFTDSKVVLGYLKNKTRRFYVYVEHRVSRILQYSNAKQWFYIPTDMNPADHGTRYMLPSSLNASFWLSNQIFEGINMNETSSQNFPLINPDMDEEIRPQAKTCKTAVKTIPTLGTDRFGRFSDWNKLLKAISLLQHIAKVCKLKLSEHSYHKGWHYCHSYKTVESRNQASNFIVKQFQQSAYCKEIQYLTEEKQLPRDSSVLVLSPFLDKDGILRVGGRLKNMNLPYP